MLIILDSRIIKFIFKYIIPLILVIIGIFSFRYRAILFNPISMFPLQMLSLDDDDEHSVNTTYTTLDVTDYDVGDNTITTTHNKGVVFDHILGELEVINEHKLENTDREIVVGVIDYNNSDASYVDDYLTDSMRHDITKVYGEDVFKSDYALQKLAHMTSKGDLSLIRNTRDEFVANFWIMGMKSEIWGPTDGNIMGFETETAHGFQFNHIDCQKRPSIKVYNPANDRSYVIYLSKTGETHAENYTQEDINIILDTIRFE